MNARIHSSFTGDLAKISDEEGADFELFDGYITGKNIVLERGKKIIQLWKAKEPDWPENHFSEVVLIFTEHNKGTQLELFHSDVPEACANRIGEGWKAYYWEPLQIYIDR